MKGFPEAWQRFVEDCTSLGDLMQSLPTGDSANPIRLIAGDDDDLEGSQDVDGSKIENRIRVFRTVVNTKFGQTLRTLFPE